MARYDVLLFSSYFCDLIITGLPEVPRLGLDLFGKEMSLEAGGTFHTVRALHRLGLRAGWVCDFGNDLFSQFVLGELRREGVDDSLARLHDHPMRFFSLAFSFEEDRGFISYADPREPFDRAPYILEHRPAAVMLSSLEYGPETLRLVEAAHGVGAQVYMDCQATAARLPAPGLAETLKAVDAFLPNAREACQIAGEDDLERAAGRLGELAPLLVIKAGASGAFAYQDGCRVHAPALPVRVVDTTGAGDCFNAGFLFGRLQGRPLEECLRLGNLCGGLSVTARGSQAAPTLEELQRYL